MNRRIFLKNLLSGFFGVTFIPGMLKSKSILNKDFSVMSGKNDKKNVIVILTDSMRADHLGFYGNTWIKSPNLDKFASESAIFDRAYCEGLPTLPTRTAMFTGKFTFPFRGWQRLEESDVPLAEILWNKGFTNALITDTYHMHKPKMSYERGFDYVQWIRGQEGDPYIVDEDINVKLEKYFKGNEQKNEETVRRQLIQYLKNVSWWKGDEDHFIAQAVKAGIKFLKEQPHNRNIFLWLDCFDPHEPWDPPPPFNRMYNPNYKGIELIHPIPGEVEGYLTKDELNHVKALYAGEVTLVDKWVGIFLDELKDMGFFENSLIIYVSDHGEPLGEHRIIRKARPWPYEELARIPLAIRHPEGYASGKRFGSFVHTCDIMPTILDFLEIKNPEDLTAKSILPILKGETEKVHKFGFSAYFESAWSIRDEDWTYIKWLERSRRDAGFTPWTVGGTLGAPTSPELYFRKNDPYEQNNIINKEPDKAEELNRELEEFVKKL